MFFSFVKKNSDKSGKWGFRSGGDAKEGSHGVGHRVVKGRRQQCLLHPHAWHHLLKRSRLSHSRMGGESSTASVQLKKNMAVRIMYGNEKARLVEKAPPKHMQMFVQCVGQRIHLGVKKEILR